VLTVYFIWIIYFFGSTLSKRLIITYDMMKNRIPLKDYLTFIAGVGIMVLMMAGLISLALFANC
jgi:hypothetical protein